MFAASSSSLVRAACGAGPSRGRQPPDERSISVPEIVSWPAVGSTATLPTPRLRRDARVQLHAAAEIFDKLDARPWAERARAELRASGETMARAGNGREQLTPQELQIALLASQGHTNAEVGRAVFLSTRTVEFRLSRAHLRPPQAGRRLPGQSSPVGSPRQDQ